MPPHSLVAAACDVLYEGDAFAKKSLTDSIISDWRSGSLVAQGPGTGPTAPSQPSRDDRVKIVAPKDVPKLGKGGTLSSRQAIIHSLVHIESCAVDLSWDIIARFGSDPAYRDHLPKRFFDDFVEVAEDESRHFTLLAQRLEDMGSSYGAFPAHEGLWQSAVETSGSLPARLAVEHCVHEARGLDVLPSTIQKFRNAGDHASADLMEKVILPEEIRHCAAGVRWLKHLYGVATGRCKGHDAADGQVSTAARNRESASNGDVDDAQSARDVLSSDRRGICGQMASLSTDDPSHCHGSNAYDADKQPQTQDAVDMHNDECKGQEIGDTPGDGPEWMIEARKYDSVEQWFHALVRAHFKGNTKPPFNQSAREAAGFTEAWYLPLQHDKQ